MTKRTTAEWEALLDGWVYDKQPDKLLGARERFAKVKEQEKAAPEAVAEVVHLRRALEGWRGNLEHHLKWTLRSDVREIEHLESKIESITRILEGHNDE